MQQNGLEKSVNAMTNNFNLSNSGIDLQSLLYSIWENKKTIISVIAIFVFLSWIDLFIKAPVYEANLLLQVTDKTDSSLNLLSTFSGPMGEQAPSSPAEIQQVLLQSRFILEPVIEKLQLDLILKPNYFPYMGRWIANHHSSNTLAKPFLGMNSYVWGGDQFKLDTFEVPHNYINKQFTIVAGDKNTYQLLNPNGKTILQGTVGQLATVIDGDTGEKFALKINTLIANIGTKYFITKLPRDNILNTISSGLVINELGKNPGYETDTGVLQLNYKDTNPNLLINILNTIGQVDLKQDQQYRAMEASSTLVFLQKELPLLKASLNQAESKLNDYRANSETLDISEASKILLAQISQAQNTIQQIQIQKVQMSQTYTPQHPFMIMLSNRMTQSQNELASLEMQLQKLPAKDQKAVSLMRDVNVKNFLYLLVLKKIQELQVIQAGTLSNVRVLSWAEMPDFAIAKKYSMTTGLSIVAGFLFSMLFMIAKLLFDKRIADPRWSEQHLQLVTLSIVPYSQKQQSTMQVQNSLFHLLAKESPHDIAIESIRSLRTSIQFLLLETTKNTICISGASPEIGKSFISANLAHVLADSGKKILLIDADLRRGHLYKFFDGVKKAGLSELITGTARQEDVISDTHHENLKFLRTGAYPPNPSELLMNEHFNVILEKFSKEFDLIVIDTAPVLAATDGVIVSALCGINLFVIGAGMHQESELTMAMQKFHHNGIKIHGTVFNHLQPEKRSHTSYYGRYNYSYEQKA